MKLSDFPPDKAADLLFAIFQRYDKARERWPFGRRIRTETHLTIEEARSLYAAGQWLSKYDEWAREAERAGGKIGVWPADHDLTQCARFLNGLSVKIDKNDPCIVLTEKDMEVIDSVVKHLDHYHLMLSFNENTKKNWKRK